MSANSTDFNQLEDYLAFSSNTINVLYNQRQQLTSVARSEESNCYQNNFLSDGDDQQRQQQHQQQNHPPLEDASIENQSEDHHVSNACNANEFLVHPQLELINLQYNVGAHCQQHQNHSISSSNRGYVLNPQFAVACHEDQHDFSKITEKTFQQPPLVMASATPSSHNNEMEINRYGESCNIQDISSRVTHLQYQPENQMSIHQQRHINDTLGHVQSKHNLPDSPPDSGSENPYSPPADQNNQSCNNNDTQTQIDLNFINKDAFMFDTHHVNSNATDEIQDVNSSIQPHKLDHHFPGNSRQPINNVPVLSNKYQNNINLSGPVQDCEELEMLLHKDQSQSKSQSDENGDDCCNKRLRYDSFHRFNDDSPRTCTSHHLYKGDTQTCSTNSAYQYDTATLQSPVAPSSNTKRPTMNRFIARSNDQSGENGSPLSDSLLDYHSIRGLKHEDYSINHNVISCMINCGSDEHSCFDYNNSPSDPNQIYLESGLNQCIRFTAFQEDTWYSTYDENHSLLPVPKYRVDADKGFNFSNADEAFVCQKKNHFQVTVYIQPLGDMRFIEIDGHWHRIENFFLHFNGAKSEAPTQVIKIEQSQSDRSKKPFHPVMIELGPEQLTKTTVGRLHFSETTSNNMRKKGKPNPDQRYFNLVVTLCAHIGEQTYPLVAHGSDKIIVRASNPGQFENDLELTWQRGQSNDLIYHTGRVGINTDNPDEALVVNGNIKLSGQLVHPSDERAKQDIQEVDTSRSLLNVSNIKLVTYRLRPEFANSVGMKSEELLTGVLAQQVGQIIPDAVKEGGSITLSNGERIDDFLVINKDRIFMENIGAVKELSHLTDSLNGRVRSLERTNVKFKIVFAFLLLFFLVCPIILDISVALR